MDLGKRALREFGEMLDTETSPCETVKRCISKMQECLKISSTRPNVTPNSLEIANSWQRAAVMALLHMSDQGDREGINEVAQPLIDVSLQIIDTASKPWPTRIPRNQLESLVGNVAMMKSKIPMIEALHARDDAAFRAALASQDGFIKTEIDNVMRDFPGGEEGRGR